MSMERICWRRSHPNIAIEVELDIIQRWSKNNGAKERFEMLVERVKLPTIELVGIDKFQGSTGVRTDAVEEG